MAIERVETTFWMDFSIADAFGISAVLDTYKRSMESFKDDIRYITELSMTCNHKIWQHYQTNESLARVYDDLWRKTNDYVYGSEEDPSKFTDEEISFYYWTLD